jgi:hypothetical protein
METKATMEPSGSPVPGVIPEPICVHHDSALADEGRLAVPKPGATTERASSPRRRNPATVRLAKLLSAVRGDKYMADAYPPTPGPSAAAHEGGDVAPAPSRTQER